MIKELNVRRLELSPKKEEKFSSVCAHCGKKVLSIYTVSDSETTVCLDCYKKYYYRCSKCGKIRSLDLNKENSNRHNGTDSYLVYYDIETGKNRFICEFCQRRDRVINYSGYTPELKFHADEFAMRFLGVELEVDRPESGDRISDTYENRDGHVYNILNIANKKDTQKNLYVKSDSSLHSGFEMVSHPMTLDYHMNHMPWKEIMSYLIEAGYLSNDTETCGLHIHVNRDSFGYAEKDQNRAIARLIYFTEKINAKLCQFSRRTHNQLQEWARSYGRRNKPENYIELTCSNQYDKYRSINLSHRDTVEFRIYKGTLNYNTFIASLQLTNELCRLAAMSSDDEIEKMGWADFIKGINPEKNRELMEYLKKQNIYPENSDEKKEVL